MALLNVMSERERDELLALSQDQDWQTAVNGLYELAKEAVIIEDSSEDPFDLLALSSGFAQGSGYVTLAMQNGANVDEALPVSLEIIRVVPELDPGALTVITPFCPFDETLTLRSGGLWRQSGRYEFEWRYVADGGGEPSVATDQLEDWLAYPTEPDAVGAVDVTIGALGF